MGFQADIAQAIIDTMKTCIDCSRYERVLWQLGDPTIECSTIGLGLLTFPPAAQVVDCAVYELRMNLIIAQCCVPVDDGQGGPPPVDQIMTISRCVTDDVERAMCCLQTLAFDIPGAVKTCRPKFQTPQYSRPMGGCVAAKINLTVPGVPCCG